MKHAVLMTICMIVLMFASSADAHASGYTMSKVEAQAAVQEAAEYKYERWGIVAVASVCMPQYVNKPESYWRKYTWHRWKCGWVGFDEDGDDVWGAMRITGHSNGSYGYMPILGGLRWGAPPS